MAFSTGTATTLASLMTALDTFATANGWTQDELNTAGGETAMHRGSVWVSFKWDAGTPTHMSIYQALGYGGTPGAGTNDSGNGYNGPSGWTSANAATERHVNAINNGPFTYWFFEQDFYLHVVVESAADVFKHFGMGTLVKLGDWTGGEYVYGHLLSGSATSGGGTFLLDGLFNNGGTNDEELAATLHVEGLPNEGGSSKWGQVWGDSTGAPNDTAGNAKIHIQGGFRAGPTATRFGRYSAGSSSGGIPQYPIELYYQDIANSRVYYLGHQPDVRGVNIRNFAPRETIVIGSDTWYLFPTQQKLSGGGTLNQGISYRRDNA